MRWRECVAILLALIGCSFPQPGFDSRAPRAETAVPVEFGAEGVTGHALRNGLTVVIEENHWHPIAALVVCYRLGSRDDPYGKQGLSHLLEHLTFRTTDGDEAVAGDQRAPGARTGHGSGTTGRDSTCFRHLVLRERVGEVLRREANRMRAIDIGEEDLEREREIVLRERRERGEGDTWQGLLEEVNATAFRLHPYRFPVSGWPETLRRVTLADVRRHFERFYAPANAILVLVGDIDRERALSLVDEEFGTIGRREPPPRRQPIPEPPPRGERRVSVAPHGLPRLVFAYHVPGFGREDPPLEVLSALLAGAGPSLVGHLLYPELAEYVEVQHSRFRHEPGLFYIKAGLGAAGGFERTAKAIDRALLALRTNGPKPEDLALAKKRLILADQLGRSPADRAAELAHYAMLSVPARAGTYSAEIASVGEEDVRRVLRSYFVPENRVVGLTGTARARGRGEEGSAP